MQYTHTQTLNIHLLIHMQKAKHSLTHTHTKHSLIHTHTAKHSLIVIHTQKAEHSLSAKNRALKPGRPNMQN